MSEKHAQGFNTATQDSNPGSRSRESEAQPLSHYALHYHLSHDSLLGFLVLILWFFYWSCIFLSTLFVFIVVVSRPFFTRVRLVDDILDIICLLLVYSTLVNKWLQKKHIKSSGTVSIQARFF